MFIGAISKSALTLRKCCKDLFALQRMEISQQPFMFWQCLARLHSPVSVASSLVQWAVSDVHGLLAQQKDLLTQNQFLLWYLKFCPVAIESSVANWNIQWLTAFFVSTVKSMRLFYSQHAFHPCLYLWQQHSCSKPLSYFCWEFQQKEAILSGTEEKNLQEKRKPVVDWRPSGILASFDLKQPLLLPFQLLFLFDRDNRCRIKPLGKKNKSESSGCRVLH